MTRLLFQGSADYSDGWKGQVHSSGCVRYPEETRLLLHGNHANDGKEHVFWSQLR